MIRPTPQPHVESPFLRPVYIMAKPAGAICNLACSYCYYLDKKQLYPSAATMMSEKVLERFISQYISASPTAEVLFTWHGGEPLMRDRRFFELVLRLQARHAGAHTIDNILQTNGTLLTDDWCRFFHDNNFLIGVSIDGPEHIHDRYRIDRAGHPTSRQVIHGISLLNRHRVEWNAMAVVNDLNVTAPLEFYHFFRDTLGCRFLQFAPIVERINGNRLCSPDEAGGSVTEHSVTPDAWGQFLCTIFDEWVTHDVGDMFVQIFDATLAGWAGVNPGVCTLAPECGDTLVLEHNGDLYTCDHFVYPAHLVGNIMEQDINDLVFNNIQNEFRQRKSASLSKKCLACQWLRLCNGECPKNRITITPAGERHNYLCEGYQHFFSHSAIWMDYMCRCWQASLPPSSVMQAIHDGHLPHP